MAIRNIVFLSLVLATASSLLGQNPARASVSYTMLSVKKNPSLRTCNVDVRIAHEVTEAQLRQIADTIKNRSCGNFSSVGIFYWLPGMLIGSGAWATTHYDPELTVHIYGLAPDAKETFAQKTNAQQGQGLIGRWQDSAAGDVLTIVRENTRYFMDMYFPNEKPHRYAELIKKGSRFIVKDDNSVGEYYVIDGAGNLRMYDRDGIIRTATKM